MNIDNDILKFVTEFRTPVCFLLGLPERNCTDQDLAIFVDYLVGYKKSDYLQKSANGLDFGYLKCLQLMPRADRTNLVLDKISEYFDRANINKGAFLPGFNREIPFSDSFKSHLTEWRTTQLRKNFRKLHDSVNRLNNSVSHMISVLSNPSSTRIELRNAAKSINHAVQSCEFHLKSGVAMSVVNNIHPQDVWRASNRLYLGRADRMAQIFKRVDADLLQRGVVSNLSGVMIKRQHRWKDAWRNIFDNHRNFRRKFSYAEEQRRIG